MLHVLYDYSVQASLVGTCKHCSVFCFNAAMSILHTCKRLPETKLHNMAYISTSVATSCDKSIKT